MNRWLRLGLQTAFGLVLLGLWLRTASLSDVLTHARVHSWWAVLLMVSLFLLTSAIRARRWLLLLRPIAPVGMVRAFAMNAAGSLLNYVLPIRSGDAARTWLLWRRHRFPPGPASWATSRWLDRWSWPGASAWRRASRRARSSCTTGSPRPTRLRSACGASSWSAGDGGRVRARRARSRSSTAGSPTRAAA